MPDPLDLFRDIDLAAFDVDGTFTDGTLFYDNEGNVLKAFSSYDGMGLNLLGRAGIVWGFISGRQDNATEARASYLGASFYLPGIGDKEEVLREISGSLGIPLDRCLYMGDDINDLTVAGAVKLFVAPANAMDAVKERAGFVTVRSGGRGAVREVCELILKARGIDPVELWMRDKTRPVGRQ